MRSASLITINVHITSSVARILAFYPEALAHNDLPSRYLGVVQVCSPLEPGKQGNS